MLGKIEGRRKGDIVDDVIQHLLKVIICLREGI